MNYIIVRPDELSHYGVKGMKWGVRKALPFIGGNRNSSPQSQQAISQRRANRRAKAKKIAKIGGVLALTALASYGAYKVSRNPQALAKGKDFVNYKILKKPKPFTTQELKKMGISTFEPVRFEPARFEPARINTRSMHGHVLKNGKEIKVPNKELAGNALRIKKSNIPKTSSVVASKKIQSTKTKDTSKQLVSNIPKTSTNVVSQKTKSTPVKDVSKQLKKQYGNLDPVKDDYYDYMNSVLKNFK